MRTIEEQQRSGIVVAICCVAFVALVAYAAITAQEVEPMAISWTAYQLSRGEEIELGRLRADNRAKAFGLARDEYGNRLSFVRPSSERNFDPRCLRCKHHVDARGTGYRLTRDGRRVHESCAIAIEHEFDMVNTAHRIGYDKKGNDDNE